MTRPNDGEAADACHICGDTESHPLIVDGGEFFCADCYDEELKERGEPQPDTAKSEDRAPVDEKQLLRRCDRIIRGSLATGRIDTFGDDTIVADLNAVRPWSTGTEAAATDGTAKSEDTEVAEAHRRALAERTLVVEPVNPCPGSRMEVVPDKYLCVVCPECAVALQALPYAHPDGQSHHMLPVHAVGSAAPSVDEPPASPRHREWSCEHCGRASYDRLRACSFCDCGMCPTCEDLHDDQAACPLTLLQQSAGEPQTDTAKSEDRTEPPPGYTTHKSYVNPRWRWCGYASGHDMGHSFDNESAARRACWAHHDAIAKPEYDRGFAAGRADGYTEACDNRKAMAQYDEAHNERMREEGAKVQRKWLHDWALERGAMAMRDDDPASAGVWEAVGDLLRLHDDADLRDCCALEDLLAKREAAAEERGRAESMAACVRKLRERAGQQVYAGAASLLSGIADEWERCDGVTGGALAKREAAAEERGHRDGFAEGHRLGALETEAVDAKLIATEQHIAELEGERDNWEKEARACAQLYEHSRDECNRLREEREPMERRIAELGDAVDIATAYARWPLGTRVLAVADVAAVLRKVAREIADDPNAIFKSDAVEMLHELANEYEGETPRESGREVSQ